MQVVPYADNILHFVYYPQNDSSCLTEETDGREKLPLWGIEAVPYKDSRSALTEEEDRILYSLSGAGIEVSRNDAEITFTGAMGEKLTTLLDCRLEPAVVLGEKPSYGLFFPLRRMRNILAWDSIRTAVWIWAAGSRSCGMITAIRAVKSLPCPSLLRIKNTESSLIMLPG